MNTKACGINIFPAEGKEKVLWESAQELCRLSPVAVEVVWLCSHPEQVFSCTTVSLFNWKKGFRSSLRFHSTLSHIVKYFTDCTFYVKLLLLLFLTGFLFVWFFYVFFFFVFFLKFCRFLDLSCGDPPSRFPRTLNCLPCGTGRLIV